MGSGGICAFHASSQRLPLKPNPPAGPTAAGPCPRPPRPGIGLQEPEWPAAVPDARPQAGLNKEMGLGQGQGREPSTPTALAALRAGNSAREDLTQGQMGPGEKGGECVSPTPALYLLPAWETTATQEGAAPAHEVTPGQGDGAPSSENFAFLFLSSQMARPLSTPSPSQMQARKKRRGVSVAAAPSLPNRGLSWVSRDVAWRTLLRSIPPS